MFKYLVLAISLIALNACSGNSESDQDPTENSSSSSSGGVGLTQGKTGQELYKEHNCHLCHNNDGLKKELPIVFENWNQQTLTRRINDTMPEKDPGACVGACAEKIAAYLLSIAPERECAEEPTPLPRRLRLLTNREYANTLNDLLQTSQGYQLIKNFESDTIVAGFDNNASGSNININRMNAYWNAAKTIAESHSDINRLLNCGQQQQQQQNQQASKDDLRRCADEFIPKFGERAFRRPLTAEELESYKELFVSATDREAAGRITLQAFLSSSNFLYRTELGQEDNGQYRLSAYEIASLLSYTFWGSMPDENLFRAAKDGHLYDPNNLKSQINRLLGDKKAELQLAYFGKQWLNAKHIANIARDEKFFPSYSSEIGLLMEQELDQVLAELFTSDTSYSVTDIFQHNFTYANNDLADFYGFSGVQHSDFRKINNIPNRKGILSLGGILAKNAKFQENDPIHRGLLVRRNLLCQEFGVPPANIGEVEPLDPNKPLRERFSAHSNNKACASCHEKIDPIGFAFENYNAVGLYQETEGNNLPIDASGILEGLNSMAGTDKHEFNSLHDLSDILANAGKDRIAYCLAEQFERYMAGIAKPDTCQVEENKQRWLNQSDKLLDLWPAVMSSPNFAIRQ